jgi:hypothetical protein
VTEGIHARGLHRSKTLIARRPGRSLRDQPSSWITLEGFDTVSSEAGPMTKAMGFRVRFAWPTTATSHNNRLQ